ncbi:MAG TPA: zinc-ribbon domain-containing protein, partial [Planctomycetota bacterium]|nr:zinc-ribbon domain-containing protein [Planctomycetota bacterium]
MNVQCTHCKTVFRVDPRKVPAGGVRARCSICRSVFEVPPPSGDGAAATESVPSAAAAPARTPEPQPAPEPARAPALEPAPAPSPAPAASTAVRTPSPFGANDPAAKARRLARALVSDIVTYFPERRD